MSFLRSLVLALLCIHSLARAAGSEDPLPRLEPRAQDKQLSEDADADILQGKKKPKKGEPGNSKSPTPSRRPVRQDPYDSCSKVLADSLARRVIWPAGGNEVFFLRQLGADMEAGDTGSWQDTNMHLMEHRLLDQKTRRVAHLRQSPLVALLLHGNPVTAATVLGWSKETIPQCPKGLANLVHLSLRRAVGKASSNRGEFAVVGSPLGTLSLDVPTRSLIEYDPDVFQSRRLQTFRNKEKFVPLYFDPGPRTVLGLKAEDGKLSIIWFDVLKDAELDAAPIPNGAKVLWDGLTALVVRADVAKKGILAVDELSLSSAAKIETKNYSLAAPAWLKEQNFTGRLHAKAGLVALVSKDIGPKASSSKSLSVLSYREGKEVWQKSGPKLRPGFLEFSPEGKKLILENTTSAYQVTGAVSMISLEDGKETVLSLDP